MPYIGKSPSAGVRQRYQYTATASQTTFSGTDLGNLTLTYTDNNFVDVFQNGVLLKGGGTDYTATSGTSVVLATGASASDVIEIIVYDAFSVGNFYNRTDSDSRYLNVAGDTMTGSLDLNGTELILDADGDTSIEASTDDTIVIDTGGSEAMRITADRDVLIAKTSEGTGTAGFEVQNTGKTLISVDSARCLDLNRLTDVGDIFKASTGGNQRIALGGGGGAGYIDGASGDTGLKFEGSHIRPRDNGNDVDDAVDLGNSSFRFDDVRATGGVITTSDKNEKNTITDSDLGLDFINKLSPKSYKYNNKTRTHYGLIAQDIETVLSDIKKDASMFAGFCKDDVSEKKDGSEYRYGLRYHEFISPMIQAIKDLKEEVDTLKAKVTALESK